MLCSRVRSDGGDARKQHSSPKSQVTSHQSLPAPLSFIPLRGSILRLWRAPSPRGYSYHMQYCTFISQPARYVAYERGKDLSTSLPLTIWSSALHSWHTGLCVEGCLFEAHLSCAFGAPLLQGATRIICNTVLSFLTLLVTSHTSEVRSLRLRFR